jgi:CHASE3 domain sensor protein
MGAAVLYTSESQRHTAQTDFAEAGTAQALVSNLLQREREYDDYLTTRSPDALNRYLDNQRRLDAELRKARAAMADDRVGGEAVALQQSLSQQWRVAAQRELARVLGGAARSPPQTYSGTG